MFCTNCGKQVPNGAQFCPHCGAAMNSNGANSQPYAQSQPNQNFNNFDNGANSFNNQFYNSSSFRWGTGAIIWFVILILGCLATIGMYSEISDYTPYLQLIGFNPTIILIIELIAAATIILLIVKKIRISVYAFYGLKLAEFLYTFMKLGSYIESEYVVASLIVLAINIVITYLVLKNYWNQLS